MKILGIETSCDETAASVVENATVVLSNVVRSQIHLHKKYGGVVPEIASRDHLKHINRIVEEALAAASLKKGTHIDGVAVTRGPGLIGSLLVGVTFAKGYAYSHNIPVCGVNHIESHLYSVFLNNKGACPQYPYLGPVVSGGHSSLFKVTSRGKHTLVGSTRDDAAGEAFDKVAKILGLGYPGGPVIDKLAKNGNPKAINFPRGMAKQDTLDFSFSGLKTAVLYYKKGFGKYAYNRDDISLADLVASFQEAVVDALLQKTFSAAHTYRLGSIVVGGGVSLNSRLREKFMAKAKTTGIEVFFPHPSFCADNAAMIAGLGYFALSKSQRKDYTFDADPTLKL